MTKCGTYSVPAIQAGLNANICMGSAERGLDDTFSRALNEVIRYELEPNGYSIELGRGYVSLLEANGIANSGGSDGFVKDITRFGWGLAVEVTRLSKDGNEVVGIVRTAAIAALGAVMSRRGLSFKQHLKNGVPSLMYICAANVNKRTEISGGLVKESGFDEESSDEGYFSAAASDSDSGLSGNASIASVSYFFANQFDQAMDSGEANMLTGERALANDVDLWSYVKKAVNASLRCCASDPDGNFIAWYPDYFGKHGVKADVVIEDVELKDLTITQSDKEFYSHVFCPGVNMRGDKMSMLRTQGVVSIEGAAAGAASAAAGLEGENVVSDQPSALISSILNIPDGEEWKYSPKELFRRYGARPAKTMTLPDFSSAQLVEEEGDNDNANASGSHPEYILPYLYALYTFMYHWAQQYTAKIQVTFMPELFPGMRIRLRSFDIEFYIQSVTHTMDYTGGFSTDIGAICPVGSLVSGMVASSGGE